MRFKCQYKKEEMCSRHTIMDTTYCKWHLVYKLFEWNSGLRKLLSIFLGILGLIYFHDAVNSIFVFLQTESIIPLFFAIFDAFPLFLFALSLIVILEKLSDDVLWPMFLSATFLLSVINSISQIVMWMIIGPASLASLVQQYNINYLDVSANLNFAIITTSISSIIYLLIFADVLRDEPTILRLFLQFRRVE